MVKAWDSVLEMKQPLKSAGYNDWSLKYSYSVWSCIFHTTVDPINRAWNLSCIMFGLENPLLGQVGIDDKLWHENESKYSFIDRFLCTSTSQWLGSLLPIIKLWGKKLLIRDVRRTTTEGTGRNRGRGGIILLCCPEKPFSYPASHRHLPLSTWVPNTNRAS